MNKLFKRGVLVTVLATVLSVGAATLSSVVAQDTITIGLITKTETNPFFVKMREGAQAKAEELGVELLFAAGSFDGDN
jgi:fructose transport system substrate-binding protein